MRLLPEALAESRQDFLQVLLVKALGNQGFVKAEPCSRAGKRLWRNPEPEMDAAFHRAAM